MSLLARIQADPRDLDLRQAYGDELSERGNVRGTFINRQLAGDPADDLSTRHERRWLGEAVYGALGSRVWRNGFLHEATLHRKCSTERVQACGRDARSHTLQVVRVHPAIGWLVSYLVPTLPAVDRVEIRHAAALQALFLHPVPCLELHVMIARSMLRKLHSWRPTLQRIEVSETLRGRERLLEELKKAGLSALL